MLATTGAGPGDGVMKEYQAAILRIGGRSNEDEIAITDLLNERMRMGWHLHSITPFATSLQGTGKLIAIFIRDT